MSESKEDAINDEKVSGVAPEPVAPGSRTQTKKGVLSSTRIVALEMEIRNIERTLLPKVFERIGNECLHANAAGAVSPTLVARGTELQAAIAEINRTEDQVNSSTADGPSTLTGKAFGVADGMKRRASRDGLHREHAKVVAQIGEACVQANKLPATIAQADVDEVKRLYARRDKLQGELKDLRRSVPWYVAHPLQTVCTAVILVLLVAGGVWGFQRFGKSNPQNSTAASPGSTIDNAIAVDDFTKQLNAQLAELEAMSAANAKSAEDADREAMQNIQLSQIEQQKADLKDKVAERERIAQNEAKTQDQLKKLAEQLFGEIKVAGAVQVASGRLKNFPLEMKGKDSAKIIDCLNTKNYLPLISLLNGQNYVQYPSAGMVSEAQRRLRKYDFKVLLNTGSSQTESAKGEQLMLITFNNAQYGTDSPYAPVQMSTRWEADPNGRGVYINWSPEQGQGLVALMDYGKLNARMESSRDQLVADIKAIRAQVTLGEYSDDMAEEKARQKLAESYVGLYQWVAAQP